MVLWIHNSVRVQWKSPPPTIITTMKLGFATNCRLLTWSQTRVWCWTTVANFPAWSDSTLGRKFWMHWRKIACLENLKNTKWLFQFAGVKLNSFVAYIDAQVTKNVNITEKRFYSKIEFLGQKKCSNFTFFLAAPKILLSQLWKPSGT